MVARTLWRRVYYNSMAFYSLPQAPNDPAAARIRWIMTFRDYVFPVLMLAYVSVIPHWFAAITMIIGGQAHFVMAYLYQYRAKKIGRLYVLVGLGVLLLGGLFFLFTPDPFLPLFLVTAFLFASHFAFDEITLHDDSWSWERGFSVLGFLALFASVLMYLVTQMFFWVPVVVAVLLLCGICVRLVQRKWPSRSERYLWYLALLLLWFMFTHLTDYLIVAMTMTITILHFFNWLIGYGIRLHGSPREKQYWLETAGTLVGSSFLGTIYAVTLTPYLGYFYSLVAYYFWSCLHVILSWMASLKPRGIS